MARRRANEETAPVYKGVPCYTDRRCIRVVKKEKSKEKKTKSEK